MNIADIRQFVPHPLSQYRDAIAETIQHFLQLATPGDAKVVQIADADGFEPLIRLALDHPTLHKLAQVLSRHRSLPKDLRTSLQTLESFAPRTPFDSIIRIIRGELGDRLHELEIDHAALAEASVAVVVPFVWRPHPDEPVRGVFKVLKPGVRERLERELAIWPEVGAFFADRCRTHGLPEIDHRETLDAAANLLRHEIDFAAEQRQLGAAADALSGIDGVRVPRLLPFCTSKVTAMERLDGVRVTDVGMTALEARRRLASRIVEALISQPMWSFEHNASFHADPHAGNLMSTEQGELAILDWAMVGTLTEYDRQEVSRLLLHAQLLDRHGICRSIERLNSGRTLNEGALQLVVDRLLVQAPNALAPEFSWVTKLMDAAVLECGAQFSEGLLLFRKSLLVLEGVIADLVGEGGFDTLLFSSTIQRMAGEWPARAFLPPSSRKLGSRLSTFDLLVAGFMFPWNAASRWIGRRTVASNW